MATLKLIIVPAKVLKDGKHKIRIAVSHKQDTRYIVTRHKVDNEKQFKGGLVTGRPDAAKINQKLQQELSRYFDALDRIDPTPFTCPDLRDYLIRSTRDPTETILVATNVKITSLESEGRKSRADLYRYTLRHFLTKFGDIPLTLINADTLRQFEQYLYDVGSGSTYVNMNLTRLKAILNDAIRRGAVKYEVHPFSFYTPPAEAERELDLSVEEVQRIRDAQVEGKPLNVARDLFMLSYYLAGINLIDLLQIDFRSTETIDYVREKTKSTKRGAKQISLTIPPEARKIIDKWIGRDGHLDFGYQFTYENFRKYIGRELKRLAKVLRIKKRVVYYSARKSVVQHGFDLGISLEVLEYSIGQSVKKNRPIFNYVRIMRGHADAAIRQILDNLQ